MLVWTLLCIPTVALAKPTVLSSIKPLTLIAQEITGDAANVDTLLPVTASPHDYPLKVSDYERLQEADIFLWVGAELESFLKKPVSNLGSAKVIANYELSGLNWPTEPARGSRHTHKHDPHIWLDPRNSILIAKSLTDMLIKIDPTNSSVYGQNLRTFATKMLELDKLLAEKLKPISTRGFVVYHEGYTHFVSRYKLTQLDYVTFTPEQKPGAKHLVGVREKLAKEGVCIFSEPYTDTQAVQALARDLKLQVGILDALGTQEVTNYSQLLERLADAFLTCLANGRG